MQITELIEKAVQCLEALGLDPETIYDRLQDAAGMTLRIAGKRLDGDGYL